MTRTWRVWGANGHRQRESFEPSYKYDWTAMGRLKSWLTALGLNGSIVV